MKNWSKGKKVSVGLLAFFLLIQVIQPSKNDDVAAGPYDISHSMAVPADVLATLKSSCYDCHSNQTTYPWYDNITPINWWVAHHIDEGKRELNFTVFGEYDARKKARKLDEITETVEESEMPLPSYLITHGDAKLTEAQRQSIADWAKAAKAAISPQAVE